MSFDPIMMPLASFCREKFVLASGLRGRARFNLLVLYHMLLSTVIIGESDWGRDRMLSCPDEPRCPREAGSFRTRE